MKRTSLQRAAGLLVVAAFLALPPSMSSQESNTQEVELPEGEGKAILLRACTSCHDLGGLKLFKGYYTEELWRELVVDMVRVGAQVKEDEVRILSKYLAQHFGPENKQK
jgi:mono/diheme cytochrome c family protein